MGACASVPKAMKAEAKGLAPEQQREEEIVAADAKVAAEVKAVEARDEKKEDVLEDGQSLGSLLKGADELKREDKRIEQPQQPEVATPAQPPAAEPEIKEIQKAEEVQAPKAAPAEVVKMSEEFAAGEVTKRSE